MKSPQRSNPHHPPPSREGASRRNWVRIGGFCLLILYMVLRLLYIVVTRDAAQEVRRHFQNHLAVQEHIGEIRSCKLNVEASLDHPNVDVEVYDVAGSRGSGLLNVEWVDLEIVSGELELPDGRKTALSETAWTGPQMVKVPGGPSLMGCSLSVGAECDDDETPARTVNVSTFWIDETEVTVADYRQCVRAGGCSTEGLTVPYSAELLEQWPTLAVYCNWGKPDRNSHPINCVDWHQAQAYCAWAGKRLPASAEWEKAARGEDGRRYPWGDTEYSPAGPLANIADESLRRSSADLVDWTAEDYNDGYQGTAPVGSFPHGASPYGVLDMAGNVWEWLADDYEDGRHVRGGSWGHGAWAMRASLWVWLDPYQRGEDHGFRCAR